jgi:hypothetical protein
MNTDQLAALILHHAFAHSVAKLLGALTLLIVGCVPGPGSLPVKPHAGQKAQVHAPLPAPAVSAPQFIVRTIHHDHKQELTRIEERLESLEKHDHHTDLELTNLRESAHKHETEHASQPEHKPVSEWKPLAEVAAPKIAVTMLSMEDPPYPQCEPCRRAAAEIQASGRYTFKSVNVGTQTGGTFPKFMWTARGRDWRPPESHAAGWYGIKLFDEWVSRTEKAP